MTDAAVQQLLDIEAIKQLKARYCMAVAKKDWDTFFSLFAEDLEFVQPDGSRHTSRDTFHAFHKQHLQDTNVWGTVPCSTPIIEITGPGSATGIWAMEDVHIYPAEGPRVGHHGYGHYTEEYVRKPGGWRFQRIQVDYHHFVPLEGGFGPPGG
ncbi:MAG: nuclear transport factor 2 family protein [Novosphingobium sp.]